VGDGTAMNQLLHQIDLDVDRLLKASSRIAELREAHRATTQQLETAISALKIIATWARCMRLTDALDAAHDARCIHQRAMDTLRLMGCAK